MKQITPKQFKKIREKAALSASELGVILGVTERQVFNYENGTTKPPKLVVEKMREIENENN